MKKRLLILLSAGLMLTAFGCSGGNAPAEEVKETSSPDEQAADGTDQGDAGEKSSEVKKYIIATDTEFKPFEYTDANGVFKGIDVDILTAIAEDQGFETEFRTLRFDDALAACKSGEVDGVMAAVSITDEREKDGYVFSDSYYVTSQSLAVEKDSDITGFEDLSGKKIGAKKATKSALYAQEMSEKYGFDMEYYEDEPAMFGAVGSGDIAACIDDTHVISYYALEAGYPLKVVEGTQKEADNFGFTVYGSENSELLDMFNKGLENIKANGRYDEIIDSYIAK